MIFFFSRITSVNQFQAHVYQADVHAKGLNLSLSESSGICSAFLANIDERKAATVTFRGQRYTIPPWSVSVLPDCRNTAFNTAKVGLCKGYFWGFKNLHDINLFLTYLYTSLSIRNLYNIYWLRSISKSILHT